MKINREKRKRKGEVKAEKIAQKRSRERGKDKRALGKTMLVSLGDWDCPGFFNRYYLKDADHLFAKKLVETHPNLSNLLKKRQKSVINGRFNWK